MSKFSDMSIFTVIVTLSLFGGAASASQYQSSLQDQVATAENGAVGHPLALAVDRVLNLENKMVEKITDGVYRLAGWGIANTVAIKAADGWIIVDAGDNLPAGLEQRRALEAEVGKITVSALLYTHSHYIWGARAWQDENTVFYAHEQLMETLRADTGVSILSGNFMARAVAQFGMLHPAEGPDAFPSHLGFSASKLTAEKAFVPPSITFKDGEVEQHTIAGIQVEVLPSKTDVAESVAYYFPGRKLLVSNALNSGVLFNLYTLRGDWYRDPAIFVAAVDLVMSRDVEFQVDIHGPARIGKADVLASLEETRDQMQLIHDQTYRSIALGKDAQQAAEFVYMPPALRDGKETYGQLESHVKRVYGARIGWMGWDVYDINPLADATFSRRTVAAMGGFDAVLAAARAANVKRQLRAWQWSLYLTGQLLTLEPEHPEAKKLRAEAARALGQRTSSANARGWYITEALLQEGTLTFAGQAIEHYPQLSQMLGKVTLEKLDSSPLDDNVQYLRYLVEPRLAEGLRAAFNVHFDNDVRYAVELRNGVIAINSRTNDGPTFRLSKNDWSELILGRKRFGELNNSLQVVDTAIGR